MITIQPSTEKDAVKLARNMRKQDIMEVEAVYRSIKCFVISSKTRICTNFYIIL